MCEGNTNTRLHTSFLHEAEEVIQKLFSLGVSIQFIQLWRRERRMKHQLMILYLTTANKFHRKNTKILGRTTDVKSSPCFHCYHDDTCHNVWQADVY